MNRDKLVNHKIFDFNKKTQEFYNIGSIKYATGELKFGFINLKDRMHIKYNSLFNEHSGSLILMNKRGEYCVIAKWTLLQSLDKFYRYESNSKKYIARRKKLHQIIRILK